MIEVQGADFRTVPLAILAVVPTDRVGLPKVPVVDPKDIPLDFSDSHLAQSLRPILHNAKGVVGIRTETGAQTRVSPTANQYIAIERASSHPSIRLDGGFKSIVRTERVERRSGGDQLHQRPGLHRFVGVNFQKGNSLRRIDEIYREFGASPQIGIFEIRLNFVSERSSDDSLTWQLRAGENCQQEQDLKNRSDGIPGLIHTWLCSPAWPEDRCGSKKCKANPR